MLFDIRLTTMGQPIIVFFHADSLNLFAIQSDAQYPFFTWVNTSIVCQRRFLHPKLTIIPSQRVYDSFLIIAAARSRFFKVF